MIETMMQWKALTVFGDTSPASAICHCLNFQQGLERDENPRQKLIFPTNIQGESINEFALNDVICNYDTENEY